jgi:RHS repeat-associated protein
MATSPAPDAAAPPGMCPGIAVLGGGGDGGDGDGNGNGGKDGAGGDGNGNGDNGNGNGDGSGACGQGATGGCPNCGNQFSAGDPVDVSTGRVFTPPKRDLDLPGFFQFDIERAYSSTRCDLDYGTGYGWMLSVDWRFEVERGSIRVTNATGLDLRFPILKAVGDEIARDAVALVKVEDGYVLRPGNEFFHYFRRYPDGKHRLTGVSYRNRGTLIFHYDRGRLSRIVDSARRSILLNRNADGRLVSLTGPADDGRVRTFARYEYSPQGDLVGVTDADGHVWRFAYDEGHRLVRQRLPTGLVFHYRYDRRGRCVETWGMHESGQLPELSPKAPATLADGKTPAKGLHHVLLDFADGYTEVTSSVNVLRFEHCDSGIKKAVNGVGGVTTREYDIQGRVIEHQDANGAVTSWAHDRMGMVIRETDPDGRTLICKRDEEGRAIEVTDPAGGIIKIQRDVFGNEERMTTQEGATTHYANDARGLLLHRVSPTGEMTRYEWDAQGNMTAEILPSGEVRRFRYDYWGRCVEKKSPTGAATTFEWYPSGKLARQTDALGRSYAYSYDGIGNVTSCTHPDGGHVRLFWGGISWLYGIEHQDGVRAQALFNREGWPLEVVGENGARHVFEYDTDGRPTAETSFQGARRRTGYDLRGHAIWTEDSSGRWEIERNGAGQIVKETAPDGSVRTFEYDARGDLVGADNGTVSLRITRDATGAVVGETVTSGGKVHEVRAQLDRDRRRTALSTSLGLDLRFTWGPVGNVSRISTSVGEEVLGARYDLDKNELVRTLPGGGSIRDGFDQLGRVRRRQVLDGGRDLAGQPDLIGRYEGTVDRRYEYNATDEVAEVESASDGSVQYEYDTRQRLTAVRVGGQLRGAWRSDAGSNPSEALPGAPARRYGPGDQLLEYGDTRYTYDDDGYLIEKNRADGAEVWRYHWGPWRELASVDCPDGRTVEFTYDCFMRRIEKRVLRDQELLRATRWVWDSWGPVHEVVLDGATGQEKTRTFLYDETSPTTPVAHRDGEGPWIYYAKGVGGAPEDLVDGSGKLLAHVPRLAYGRAQRDPDAPAETPFAYEGQYEDEETGLHYNRYRYYDPDTGRFLSPDPAGIEDGSRNLYAYGRNPIGWVDPAGLQHQLCVEASNIPGMPVGSGNSSGTADFNPNDQFFHPAAQARLHSERAMLNDLRNIRERSERAGQGNPLQGRSIRVRGTRPPCHNCHRAMRAFAEQNQMGSIDYVYTNRPATTPSDTMVRYGPGGNPQFGSWDGTNFNAANASPQAQQLAAAYQMNNGNITPGGRRDVNRESTPGGYRYTNGATAKGTYDNITANYN